MLLAADLYAHKRVEMVGGFNIWGYRGAVVKQRVPGDARVLLLGGTRAYGYGASADDTIAHALEWELTVQTQRRTTVIDAAHMGATASDYAAMVDRHADLDPDVIVLYDDLGYAPRARAGRRSPVPSTGMSRFFRSCSKRKACSSGKGRPWCRGRSAGCSRRSDAG